MKSEDLLAVAPEGFEIPCGILRGAEVIAGGSFVILDSFLGATTMDSVET